MGFSDGKLDAGFRVRLRIRVAALGCDRAQWGVAGMGAFRGGSGAGVHEQLTELREL
jgi:hypothetical protein